MEITKEVLQFRVAGMTQQLGKLLENTANLQGALNLCNNLLEYLEAPELKEPPEPGPDETPETPDSDDGASPLNEE